MYNSNKNKYLVYIMAESVIDNFKTAINNAYKNITHTESEKSHDGVADAESENIFKDYTNTNLKESDIIKILIDKLNEKSHGTEGVADATNNKKAISITKYNYGYYLNTIEYSKYDLFFYILIKIFNFFTINFDTNNNNIISTDEENKKTFDNIILSINLFINNINYFNKIYKKIIFNKNYIAIINYIYNEFNSYSYSININDMHRALKIDKNEIVSLLLLISPLLYYNGDININNNIVSYSSNEDINNNNIILFLYYLIADIQTNITTNNNYDINQIKNILYYIIIISSNNDEAKNLYKKVFNLPLPDNYKQLRTDIGIIFDNINKNSYFYKVFMHIETKNDITFNDLLIKSLNVISVYEYLIINKDKDIIDVFKENPEIEDNYNINNNSLELVEISKDKINFNNNTYKLIGYIDENNTYYEINKAGEGDGAGGDSADGVDTGDGGDGEGDNVVDKTKKQNNNNNYKLLIYKKQEQEQEQEQKQIITKLKEKYTYNCDNINLKWSDQSCYIDSLFVALFNKKHKKMDDIIYNLDISNNFLLNIKETYDYRVTSDTAISPELLKKKFIITYDYKINDNDKNQLFYYRSLIKNHLIYLYDTISNNKNFSKADYNLNEFRTFIQDYITHHNNIQEIDYDNFNAKFIETDSEDTEENYTLVDDKYKNLLLAQKQKSQKSLKVISNTIIWTANMQQDYNDLYNALNEIFNNSININFITQPYTGNNNLDLDEQYINSLFIEHNITNITNSIFIHFFRFDAIKETNNNFSLNPSITFQNNNKNYNLQSIILHNGLTHNQGHYTCIFKCNDIWYLYNDLSDNKVSNIGNFDNITSQQKQQIVGLYYI